MKAFLYARVSTGEQEWSHERQDKDCRLVSDYMVVLLREFPNPSKFRPNQRRTTMQTFKQRVTAFTADL